MADKEFNRWHKRFRRIDRNDSRIAWDAGRTEGRRDAHEANIVLLNENLKLRAEIAALKKEQSHVQ